MGYVETTILMEGGQARKKFVKPKSGAVNIAKDKQTFFKDAIGYVWRKGFKPFTIIREKDLQQLDLSEMKDFEKQEFTAEDVSNLIVRSFQAGFIKGFKKNQMVNQMIIFVLIGVALIGILSVLTFQNTSNILGIVKAIPTS
jgi:hypothetical protein